MLNKFYNWMMAQAERKNAVWVLVCISFIESSFFPLPPDPVLAVMVAKKPQNTMHYAFVCTVASVIGGFLGYYIGHEFFHLIGLRILEFYGMVEKFNDLIKTLNEWAFWIICAKGLTPIPYKIVTIASGMAHIDLFTFGIASVITRSMRFFLLSFICKKFGNSVLSFLEKHKKLSIIIVIGSVVLGMLLLKLVM